jgi:C-terminal processing protease CtpA/Prc
LTSDDAAIYHPQRSGEAKLALEQSFDQRSKKRNSFRLRIRTIKCARALFAVVSFAVLAFGTVCCGGRDAGAAPTVQNLRTLAKLFGYLRYFHPSDEAARVDWDALAVHAAAKVKDAPDSKALKAALEEVFRPVAPSMTLYVKGEDVPASGRTAVSPDAASKAVSWQHMGLGTGASNSIYRSIRLNRPFEMAGQATVGHVHIDATSHRGKTVRLSAWVKVQARGMNGQAQLWLRVDRPSGPGFFDNMRDRPIRSPAWAEYAISGPVAEDAQRIAFGALIYGKGKFLIDGFRISVTDAAGREAPVVVENGGFEEGDTGAAPRSWGIESPAMEFGVREEDVYEGKRALFFATRIQPVAIPLFEKRAPADGVIDKEIGRGLCARIPLVLETDEQGTIPRSNPDELGRLREALEALLRAPLSGGNEVVRLGDIVIAWNVFQHFFPYFDEVNVDWDAVLTRSLERAIADRTEEDFLRTLNWIIARLNDGHGGVYHALQQKLGMPPFRIEWIENKAVITASRDASFKRGDIVLAVDGKKAEAILREDEEFFSGSPQWKRIKATAQFGVGPAETKSSARLQRGREVLEVTFERSAQTPVSAPPALPPIDKLKDGVLYVDLTRASWQDINARIQELAPARGVVFDLRGYPNGNHQVLCHLLREPDKSSAWMKIPLVVLPDREGWTYQGFGWNLPTASPRIGGRVVFMTDGRAISYAESFMSFVEHYKLGEIVGEPTAGANGNVNSFALPGGYSVSWTGMKVVKHDGSQHHTIGILPTDPCRRTLAGIASGRDEFLEKALEVISK